MSWIILALITTILWSVSAIISKFCRVSYIESSLGYTIFIAPVSLFTLLLLFLEPFTPLPLPSALLALSTGLAITIGYTLYLEALHKEEVSRVIILFGTTPLFILVLATIFLKETLTLSGYFAFTLIFIGSTLISIRKVKDRIRLTLGTMFVLLSSVLYACQDVIFKHLSQANLTTIMFYREGGYIISIFLILIVSGKARAQIRKVISDINLKKTAIVYSAEFLGMAGVFISYLAIQQGLVSLVTVTLGFQTVFTFLFTLIISFYLPQFIKEDINPKTIIIKIISIALMFGGLYLIAI
jgi:drug/metabolite transporter (DMT)-like permease